MVKLSLTCTCVALYIHFLLATETQISVSFAILLVLSKVFAIFTFLICHNVKFSGGFLTKNESWKSILDEDYHGEKSMKVLVEKES